MKTMNSPLVLGITLLLLGGATVSCEARPPRGDRGGAGFGRHQVEAGSPTSGTTGSAQESVQSTITPTDGSTSSTDGAASSGRKRREKRQPTAEQKAQMEARLKEWASQNGYTTSTDENGRLIVTDSEGKVVRPPRGPGGNRGRRGPEPTAEQKAAFETKLKAWAAEKGYSTETDENGRLIVKDGNGNCVRPTPEELGLPKPPSPPDSSDGSQSSGEDTTQNN